LSVVVESGSRGWLASLHDRVRMTASAFREANN
jgi:hypothetical protein